VVSETKTDDGVLSENPEDNPNENANAESDEEEEPESIVDFDAIFIPDSPKKAGLIIPQLAYYDIKDVYLLGTNLWHSESLIKIADQYVQGAIMPDGFFAGSKSPRVRNFVELFENTYQETPEFIEAILYDSAMILFKVVSEPSIRFRSEIRDGLLNMNDYPGVTGMTRFDENGDVLRRLYLLRVKGKTFVELE
jgi:ABC-type branched-subunit amino acid transport system substrate-binding protein